MASVATPQRPHRPRTTSSKVSMPTRTKVVDEKLILQYEARIKELEAENKALKEKQMEINTAKELYLKIFEDFPALIWRSRLDKLCDYFNRTWLEWTGRTQEQEFGNGWTEGVHPDDFDRCLETYVTAFDKREYFYMEYRLKNKHGEYRWIGDHGTPFFDLDDTFLGYIGSCYDITENKLNERKLVNLNATKDKFFSIVAHDLRNPIAAFVSISELLMDNHEEFDEEEMLEIATHLHKDSKNALLLLENLLDWSRSQSDDISFRPKSINLVNLCGEVVDQVNLCAKAKKITIDCKPEDLKAGFGGHDGQLTVTADENMLKTVLRNLLMNSIKFTNSGGSIKLKAERLRENGNKNSTVLVTVSDNGVGIPKDEVAGLFDLVKSSKSKLGTQQEGGSGLGLVICKEFIKKHNGRIWAESQLDKGTDFKFTIPPQAAAW